MSAWIDPTATLTRLSTTLPAAALTTDVALDQHFGGVVLRSYYVQARAPRGSHDPAWPLLGTTLLLACVVGRGRRARR